MEILTVGSIAFDSIKTPFGERKRIVGGSVTYFSLAASYFAPVKLVSVVGDDFTKREEAVFEGRRIDLLGLQRRTGKTFHWAGEYHYDFNERTTLATELNVFADFKPMLPAAYRDGADIVFLANIDPEVQASVLDQIKHSVVIGCDTMNFWIEHKRAALERILARVDMLMINESEVREIAGEPNILRAGLRILQMGPKHLVVKRGEYGVLILSPGSFFALPAFPVEDVQDPTGAGDTFAGGFFGCLAEKKKIDEPALRRAAVMGSVMASFCVEAFGPDALLHLSRDDIAERFRAFKRLTHFEGE
jgi:sugar/nucleoside kinase (ribokinase family)